MGNNEEFVTKVDLRNMVLGQLNTVNAIYRTIDEERTRLMRVCSELGVSHETILNTLRKGMNGESS